MDDFKRNADDAVDNAGNANDEVSNHEHQASQESLADALEGLRQDAGAQGRTLEQAEQQGVLEGGHDGSAATPGFFGDHRAIDDTNTEGNSNQ